MAPGTTMAMTRCWPPIKHRLKCRGTRWPPGSAAGSGAARPPRTSSTRRATRKGSSHGHGGLSRVGSLAMSTPGSLDWLLDDLVTRVANVDKAVILSRDGLAIGASATVDREDAEYLAAVAAGFQSLARGFGQHLGCGNPRQTIVELESAFLFVTA